MPKHPIQQFNDFAQLIEELDKLVEQNYIDKKVMGDLVLFNYTRKCTYDKNWNPHTLICRGIIFDVVSKELVNLPFFKFFNLSELTDFVIPDCPYSIYDKADGSLVSVYHYKDKWHCSTRGSFESEQAQFAQQIVDKYWPKDADTNLTYLFEVIYPQNKIVLDYKEFSGLVLLGGFCKKTFEDFAPEDIYNPFTGIGQFKIVDKISTDQHFLEYFRSFDQEILSGQLPLSEGFCVRFENGQRIKLKTQKYLSLHKVIFGLTPLKIWETLLNKTYNEYRFHLPEEMLGEADKIVNNILDDMAHIGIDVNTIYSGFIMDTLAPEHTPQNFAKYIAPYSKEYQNILWMVFHNKMDEARNLILKYCRPDDNSSGKIKIRRMKDE